MPNEEQSTMQQVIMRQANQDTSHHRTGIVVGGELIDMRGMLPGETSFKPVIERAWLIAISNAYTNSDVSLQQRLQNVNEIAREAISRNILSEQQVNNKLIELGINQNAQTESTAQPSEKTQPAEHIIRELTPANGHQLWIHRFGEGKNQRLYGSSAAKMITANEMVQKLFRDGFVSQATQIAGTMSPVQDIASAISAYQSRYYDDSHVAVFEFPSNLDPSEWVSKTRSIQEMLLGGGFKVPKEYLKSVIVRESEEIIRNPNYNPDFQIK